ncbi:MAG TPA: TraB/GumN family protein [Caulobacteraceae bacterium]
MLIAVLAVMSGSVAHAEPATWTLRDEDSAITLLGSVHVLPPDLDWRTARLSRVIAQADEIWFERTDDSGGAAFIAAGRSGTPLSSRLTTRDWARLQGHARRLGFDAGLLERFQPWLAALLLHYRAQEGAGLRHQSGVEPQIQALKPDVPHRALETGEELARTLGRVPARAQIRLLRTQLDALDQGALADRELLDAWAAGRLGPLMSHAVEQQSEAPEWHEAAVTQRNRRWA